MKHLLATIAIISCVLLQTYGQVTIGVKVGKTANVNPGTNHLIVNRQDPINESLFNIEQVQYSEQIGLMARLDRGNFWFMSELMYGQSTAQYSMIYVREIREGQISMKMNEKRSFLELPVSVGVSLGVFEVFSGFSAVHSFGYRNDLETVAGFTSSQPSLRYGWHSGLGVNFGHILVDVRYQQEFSNYGQDRYLNGQELLLKNSPGRFLGTVAVRI